MRLILWIDGSNRLFESRERVNFSSAQNETLSGVPIIQVVCLLESIAETQPLLQPASLE
jgi:hypothetical protein